MKRNAKQPGSRQGALSRILALLIVTVGIECSFGQGTIVHITFDGPPPIPGELYVFREYYEAGMAFVALKDPRGYGDFVRMNKYPYYPYPYNGTAYIQANLFAPIEVRSLAGLPFGLISVDLAEFDAGTPPETSTVRFIGFRSDGSVVTNRFTTDGLIWVEGVPDFQTFYFGPEFSEGLTRVWIERASWLDFSLDNLYVYIIPEPSPVLLSLGGGLLFLAVRGRRPCSNARGHLAAEECRRDAHLTTPVGPRGRPDAVWDQPQGGSNPKRRQNSSTGA